MEIRRGGDGREYKVTADGTWYDSRTADRVVEVLESMRKLGKRVRIFYTYQNVEDAQKNGSDFPAGTAWTDIYYVTGRLGRTCGDIKAPILLARSRSIGGVSILEHLIGCIMTTDGGVWYKMDGFKFPLWRIVRRVLDGKTFHCLEYKTDGMDAYKEFGRFDGEAGAVKLRDYMTGKRFTLGGR